MYKKLVLTFREETALERKKALSNWRTSQPAIDRYKVVGMPAMPEAGVGKLANVCSN